MVSSYSNQAANVSGSAHSGVSRRKVMAGTVWAVPTIVMATAVPSHAAISPMSCSPGTLDWDLAPKNGSKVVNGSMIPIRLASGTTVYAKLTLGGSPANTQVRTGWTTRNTSDYDMTVGKTALGSADGVYSITTTSGSNSLIMNQMTNTTRTVTLDFFEDSAGTQPLTVFNVSVPLDDFSTARSWVSGIFAQYPVPEKSYQEAWSVQGKTAAGMTVTASASSLTRPYSSTASTLANVRGTGSPSDPWYFPSSLTSASQRQVGGNLQTSFGATGLRSITVTYDGNNLEFSGAQGAALGTINVCG